MTRPYSMTHIGGQWCAIVKWTGDRYEVIEIYKLYKRDENKMRAKCARMNDAYTAHSDR